MAIPTVTNLLADAQTKISSKRLIQLTNPESPSANTVDITILQKSCEDSALYFEIKAAKNYDDTNVLHRQAALLGVEAFLKQYAKGASSEVRNLFERYDGMLETINNARGFRISASQKLERDQDKFKSSFFDNYRPN